MKNGSANAKLQIMYKIVNRVGYRCSSRCAMKLQELCELDPVGTIENEEEKRKENSRESVDVDGSSAVALCLGGSRRDCRLTGQ